jgi:hypothetical protein
MGRRCTLMIGSEHDPHSRFGQLNPWIAKSISTCKDGKEDMLYSNQPCSNTDDPRRFDCRRKLSIWHYDRGIGACHCMRCSQLLECAAGGRAELLGSTKGRRKSIGVFSLHAKFYRDASSESCKERKKERKKDKTNKQSQDSWSSKVSCSRHEAGT